MRAARTLLLGTALVTLLATGCEWHFETLDGAGGPNGRIDANVGTFNATVLYNGRPHVFYRDESIGHLHHAYYTGIGWAFETLDGAGGANGRVNANLGGYNATVLYDGRPHVFYYDYDNDTLRHAYYTGSAWGFETLDGNSGPNGRIEAEVGTDKAAVLYNGLPHVFYRDETSDTLRHAYYTGSAWGFETLEGNGGTNGRIEANVGEYIATVLYNGLPHVFYYDTTNDTLRHAYYNGFFWAFETLDGNGGTNGRVNANVGTYNSVMLYNGRPHIFYRDEMNHTLRHAYWNGLFWSFETLDGNGGTNGRVNANLAWWNASVLYGGRPHVFYYDFTNLELRHAYYNGFFWAFETLDGNGGPNGRVNADVGQYNATVLYGGRPDVFYRDISNTNLRHAYFG